MVKLELELTDIDYNYLISEYLPKMADKLRESGSPLASLVGGGLASTLLMNAPTAAKDKLAAELLNANAAVLEQKAGELAAQYGIPGRVRNVKATAVNE